jgi:4-amino-4-deoxy-L-arabinose transferase-like glycosyltransferase
MHTRFRRLAPALALAALALALRCYNLPAPLLDYHSWRQADSSAIARNYTANGYRLFFPQVDWGGQTPGYVESEFPLYTYTLALLYGAFGAYEWVGRLLSALAGAASAAALYGLVRSSSRPRIAHDDRAAIYAGLSLALMPFPIYFGRAVMPDTWMLLAAILALWTFRRWLDGPSAGRYAAALVCGLLAPLAKTPNLLIAGVPLAYMALADWARRRNQEPRTENRFVVPGSYVGIISLLALYGLCFTLPSLLWMRHARALPLDPRLSFGIGEKLFDLDLLLDPQFYLLLARWSVENVITLAGLPFLFLVFGFSILDWRSRHKRSKIKNPNSTMAWLPYAWLLGVLLFFLAGAAGVVGQDYYILPLAGPAAWFVGLGIDRAQRLLEASDERRTTNGDPQARPLRPSSFVVRRGWLSYLIPGCAFVALGALSLIRIAPLYRTTDFYATLGRRLNMALPAGARVGVIAPAVSEILYYGERKGWRLDPGVIVPGGLASLPPDLGVRYLLVADPALSERRDVLTAALHEYRRLPVGPYALLLDLARPGLQQPADMLWETGHLVEEPFLGYWRQAGGADRYGLPISDALDGPEGREQFFERALLLQNKRGVKRLLLGRLLLEAQGRVPVPAETVGPWRAAWEQAGGERGLGMALSPLLEEGGRHVQYFEFGMLEAAPGEAPAPGAAGRMLLEARGLTEERQIELAAKEGE